MAASIALQLGGGIAVFIVCLLIEAGATVGVLEHFGGDAISRCNTYSLGLSLDAPHETVCRKINAMVADGEVARDARGALTLTAKPLAECAVPRGREQVEDMLTAAGRIRQVLGCGRSGPARPAQPPLEALEGT